jgi:hypothetical protein
MVLALGQGQGAMLLATGKNTGTTPVHSHPSGQPAINAGQPHLLQIMNKPSH